jgi:hypothetical protein
MPERAALFQPPGEISGLGYFLFKNPRDKRDLEMLLRETQAEDEEHERTHIS